jgi:CBS domain-containing protein
LFGTVHLNSTNAAIVRSFEGIKEMNHFLECTASQYMTSAVKSVPRHCSMSEVKILFEQHDFDAFPIVENGKLLGIVTKFDFLKVFAFTTGQMVPSYDELMRRTVGEVMTEAVIDVEPATPLTRVLQLMVNLKIRSFPVRNADHDLVGVISRGDVMRALGTATQET